MKRNMLILFLAAALLIACLSVSAMAAEGQKPEDLNQISAYAAQTMSSLFMIHLLAAPSSTLVLWFFFLFAS